MGHTLTKSIDNTLNAKLIESFRRVRKDSHEICIPLELEDYCIQTMDDVSPIKWHIAHTSWFFETFLLVPYLKNYRVYHPKFAHLFNSYYELAGTFHPRAERGFLSRPTVEDIFSYRNHIDKAMLELLNDEQHKNRRAILLRTQIGIHHEQQHQELMLTDIKHIFSYNPLKPIYKKTELPLTRNISPLNWFEHPGGLEQVGKDYGQDFIFDNESPQHKTYLSPFAIASRLVTNEEYINFIDDGGYDNPQFWLSEGWKLVKDNSLASPLYWSRNNAKWEHMSLSGMRNVDPHSPVCHVSYFEADAYARWAKLRLPSEEEWEVSARDNVIQGNLREQNFLHPIASSILDTNQFYGDVWEWTKSAYNAYPTYTPSEGALGEYNGKFMCGQYVLRGGSCVTPLNHIRASYRNFFYPKDRWQFTGIRLAKDL